MAFTPGQVSLKRRRGSFHQNARGRKPKVLQNNPKLTSICISVCAILFCRRGILTSTNCSGAVDGVDDMLQAEILQHEYDNSNFSKSSLPRLQGHRESFLDMKDVMRLMFLQKGRELVAVRCFTNCALVSCASWGTYGLQTSQSRPLACCDVKYQVFANFPKAKASYQESFHRCWTRQNTCKSAQPTLSSVKHKC